MMQAAEAYPETRLPAGSDKTAALPASKPFAITPGERFWWALFVVVFSTTVARVSNLNEPFGRTYEGTVCGPIVCAARNTVRYGLLATRFGYVENCDVVPRERFTFYNHHPALVPLTMAAGAALFGDQPWSYRLPAAICSILATALLFSMLSRKFDWPTGLITALFYAFCPFSWMLGDMPDVVGPHVVFFGLATIECYSRWFDQKNPRWLYLALVSWVFCAFSDWPAFVLPPVLAVHYFLNRPRSWYRIIPFALFAMALMGFHFYWLTRGGDTSVYNQFFHRINGKTDNGHVFGLKDYYNDAIKGYVFRTFTIPVVCLAFAYLAATVLIAVHQIRKLAAHDTILIMIGWGILHVLIGFQSSHQHLWVWSVVLPGITAAAAVACRGIWKLAGQRVQHSTTARVAVAFLACVFLVSSYLKAFAINDATLTEQPMIYSIRDLGTFIKETVPSGQGVLTSDMTDESTQDSEPALWYYADRQIRNNIRTVKQLDVAIGKRENWENGHPIINYHIDFDGQGGGDYPLYYHIIQQGGPPPLWFVLPAEHVQELPELSAALNQRYAHWAVKGYILYYLKETPQEQAAKEGAGEHASN